MKLKTIFEEGASDPERNLKLIADVSSLYFPIKDQNLHKPMNIPVPDNLKPEQVHIKAMEWRPAASRWMYLVYNLDKAEYFSAIDTSKFAVINREESHLVLDRDDELTSMVMEVFADALKQWDLHVMKHAIFKYRFEIEADQTPKQLPKPG